MHVTTHRNSFVTFAKSLQKKVHHRQLRHLWLLSAMYTICDKKWSTKNHFFSHIDKKSDIKYQIPWPRQNQSWAHSGLSRTKGEQFINSNRRSRQKGAPKRPYSVFVASVPYSLSAQCANSNEERLTFKGWGNYSLIFRKLVEKCTFFMASSYNL